MDLYLDPAGTNRVIDILVKEGIFLGIRETNLDPRVVSPSISASPAPLSSLSRIPTRENSEIEQAPLSSNPDLSSLVARLALIRESLERKQLSVYEGKDQGTTALASTGEKSQANCLACVDQTSSDLTRYYKEGPMTSSFKLEDDVTMEMPHLEDSLLMYSDDEYLSDQSLSSLSDSRRLSYRSIVNSSNSDIPNVLTHDREDYLTDGSDSGSRFPIPDTHYNACERNVGTTLGNQTSSSRPHSRVSSDNTSGCQDNTLPSNCALGNKTSPWGRMKLTNGLV